jgi:hypothetical protein
MPAVESELLTAAPHSQARRAFLPVIAAGMAFGILAVLPLLTSPGDTMKYLGDTLSQPRRWPSRTPRRLHSPLHGQPFSFRSSSNPALPEMTSIPYR